MKHHDKLCPGGDWEATGRRCVPKVDPKVIWSSISVAKGNILEVISGAILDIYIYICIDNCIYVYYFV